MSVRKTISIFALLLLVLIVIAGGLAGFSVWSISDCEYLDDSDLYVERPAIPRFKNGYMDFEHAAGTLIIEKEENRRIIKLLSAFYSNFTGGKTFTDKAEKSGKLEEARKLLGTHPVALTMLDKGFHKPYCQVFYMM